MLIKHFVTFMAIIYWLYEHRVMLVLVIYLLHLICGHQYNQRKQSTLLTDEKKEEKTYCTEEIHHSTFILMNHRHPTMPNRNKRTSINMVMHFNYFACITEICKHYMRMHTSVFWSKNKKIQRRIWENKIETKKKLNNMKHQFVKSSNHWLHFFYIGISI